MAVPALDKQDPDTINAVNLQKKKQNQELARNTNFANNCCKTVISVCIRQNAISLCQGIRNCTLKAYLLRNKQNKARNYRKHSSKFFQNDFCSRKKQSEMLALLAQNLGCKKYRFEIAVLWNDACNNKLKRWSKQKILMMVIIVKIVNETSNHYYNKVKNQKKNF